MTLRETSFYKERNRCTEGVTHPRSHSCLVQSSALSSERPVPGSALLAPAPYSPQLPSYFSCLKLPFPLCKMGTSVPTSFKSNVWKGSSTETLYSRHLIGEVTGQSHNLTLQPPASHMGGTELTWHVDASGGVWGHPACSSPREVQGPAPPWSPELSTGTFKHLETGCVRHC